MASDSQGKWFKVDNNWRVNIQGCDEPAAFVCEQRKYPVYLPLKQYHTALLHVRSACMTCERVSAVFLAILSLISCCFSGATIADVFHQHYLNQHLLNNPQDQNVADDTNLNLQQVLQVLAQRGFQPTRNTKSTQLPPSTPPSTYSFHSEEGCKHSEWWFCLKVVRC